MKSTFFALACLACLASSAIANTPDYSSENGKADRAVDSITKALDSIKNGKSTYEADLIKYLPSTEAGANELKLTGTYATKSTDSTGKSAVTLMTFNINLKVVGGKIVGMVATEEIRYGWSQHSIEDANNAAQASMSTTKKSWVFGPADFVAAHRGHGPTPDTNAHTSIASETSGQKKVNSPSTSPKQEQTVACNAVSPSSPGCP